MDADSFQRILTTFADTPADVDVSKGRVFVQIRNEVIDAQIFMRDGALVVKESSSQWPAEQWLVKRIAQLPLLADRILGFVPGESTFVVPSGGFLDELEKAPEEQEAITSNAVTTAKGFLARRPAGTASVLYLTADAGEGKTTVIYELSRQLASAYKQKLVDWLLVPISLGGRPFLRFDDVIVAALVNRLRFPFLYYDSFVELVRLGVLVPALDGFEEMFIENVSGDAVSALGNLMRELRSSGAVLIAARKAYFEFKRLETQARLFDTLAGASVTFARLALQRWDRGHFLEYGRMRHVDGVDDLYDEVASRIGADHPLLTRAVLVRRLFEVTRESVTREELLRRLEEAPGDYLVQFVRAIVTREAQEKWIDKSGEPARPLLSEEEHHELLGIVAQEMWTGGVEALREDVIELVAELFCDSRSKSAIVQRQVVERLKQHALIVRAEPGARLLAFDHVEFYHFFLGCALEVALRTGSHADLRQIMHRGMLPELAIDVAAARLRALGVNMMSVIDLLNLLGRTDTRPSFVRENAGSLSLRIVRAETNRAEARLEDLTIPGNSLALGKLAKLLFVRCYFQPTIVRSEVTNEVFFEACEFESLSLQDENSLVGARFVNCTVRSITQPGSEDEVFVPGQIVTILERSGAEVVASSGVIAEEPVEPDEALHLTRRVLRAFTRSTELNEDTIKKRLGVKGAYFLAEVLPGLLDAGMIYEMAYHGKGFQRRFRLGIGLSRLEKCIERSQGSFERFVAGIGTAER
jgi:hypothetical protein